MKNGISVLTVVPQCPYSTRKRTKELINEFSFFSPKWFQILGCPPGLESNIRSLKGKMQFPFYLLFFFIHILIAALKFKPHLIHANWAIPAGFLSLIVGKITKTPVVVTVHGADAYQRGFRRSIIRFVLKRVNHIVVVSDHIKNMLSQFVSLKNLTVIPNVVDVSTIRSAKKKVDTSEVKKKIGIEPTDKVIFTIRRLVPEKRVRDLIYAAEKVLKRASNVCFIIAGDGPELPTLKNLAAQYSLEDHIKFLGAITEQEKLDLLSIADICVHTSVQEGLSLALLEAMAAETILIASAAAGQSDIIKHGETGLLFPASDIDALANRIVYALTTSGLESMRARAADFVEKNHSSEGHTQGYLDLFRSVQ
jgi:glycosyltransferase involved in cell wall biosynthesis